MEKKSDGLPPFKWGNKKSGEDKDVQYYESFTYGGCEYFLYDCVSVGDGSSKVDSGVFFVGMIIKMWEYNDQRQDPRRVELLWFFKPYELSLYLGGVQDVLANELFLASGSGLGLTNENILEAVSGKCRVLCISKDVRNPQPSEEEIKSADFVFHRTYDVGTSRILDTIDDNIAGVDVKFIFNRTSSERKASALQKVETDIQRTADSLNPSTSGSVMQSAGNACDLSVLSVHKQLASKQSTLAEEKSNKESGRLDGELDSFSSSSSRRHDCHGRKDQGDEVGKQPAKQKSRLADERCIKDSYCVDDMLQKKRRLDGSVAVPEGRFKGPQKTRNDGRRNIETIRRDETVGRSRLAEERRSNDYYGLDVMPLKKPRLDGSVAVSEGRRRVSQTTSHDGEKDLQSMRKDVMVEKSRLAGERCSRDYMPQKKLESLSNAECRRDYGVFEVTQKTNIEGIKWFRKLSWEEDLRCAEGKGTLVVLRNLDPSYTSKEVENIVYSALNEQCTARMIERTSATIPHIGEALVIFETTDAAKRVIRRLHEGCLLLSNGRVLVATSGKVNPPAMPSLPFPGHINIQRRGKRSAAVTSHCSQGNNIEFEMGMEWWLHYGIYKQIWKWIYERQVEEKKKFQLDVEPKHI